MTQSLFETFGGLDLPVSATDVVDTLAPLDPARDTLVSLFQTAINAELLAPWSTIMATLDPTHPLRTGGPNPINDVLPLEPSPTVMQQRKAVFPLLCLHRTGTARYDEIALGGQVERLTQSWDVHYILGPVDTGTLRKVADICVAVTKIVRLVIRRRGHPAFQNGALQWYPAHFGTVGTLGTVTLTGYDGPGQAQFATGPDAPLYYAVTMHLETAEHTVDDPNAFGNFDATDIEIAAGDDADLLPDMAQLQTDVPYQDP